MGKDKIFSVLPFLNAMTSETVKSSASELKFYPFYNSQSVPSKQEKQSSIFTLGSSVTAVLSVSNINQVISNQTKELNSSYELAIAGRSNCGKSSLINSLLNEKVAISSKTPGKTQQLILHTLNCPPPFNITLVDTPGYGYAEAPDKEMEKWRVIAENYITKRSFLKNTIVLIDSRRGVMKSDELLFDFLNEHRRHNTIVLTKCDSLKVQELKNVMMKVAHLAARYPRTFGTVFATSSKLGYGIKELRMFLMFAVTNSELFDKASK